MECKKCGYTGDPEFGDFRDEDIPSLPLHIRCPKCKSTKHITIVAWERVKMAILYPEFCTGSPDWRARYGIGHIKTRKAISLLKQSYSIYCPICEWGEGGGLEKEKVEELQKLLVETVKTP